MESPGESNGKRERRVRKLLKGFYGSNGKLEADDDPTSVDSMAFDIDQYFNEVLRGQDLAGLQSIIEKFEKGMISIQSRFFHNVVSVHPTLVSTLMK